MLITIRAEKKHSLENKNRQDMKPAKALDAQWIPTGCILS
jgi:hypothetical protein